VKKNVSVWMAVVASVVLAARAGGQAPSRPLSPQQQHAEIQKRNAARIDKGCRISLSLLGEATGRDRTTMPSDVADGNPHTRCVTWGVPILYRFDLVAKLPVTQVNFICEDYVGCPSPKEVEIRLSDGTALKKTLDLIRPSRENPYPRQTVEVGKEIEWVEVKIVSLHPGETVEGRQPVNYGGIGEIEIVTSADLTPYLTVADFNPNAPSYIVGGTPRSDYSGITVKMPPVIPLGVHPGIYLSREEIVALRPLIKADPRGAAMLERLFSQCDQWLQAPVVFPDPNIPAQMKDRSDAQAQAHGLLSKQAGWFGWAWQLSDDPKYAQRAREILVGYAKLYPNDYKEHKGVHPSDTSKVMAQRLSEAMWVLPLIQSYDMVKTAPCMTDADRHLIEEDLIRTCLTFINGKRSAKDEVAARERRDPNWRTADPGTKREIVGNWTNFYNAAYIQGGICLGDRDWIDIGMDNTRMNLARGIGDDGMWGEGAIGYHLFGRHALVCCLEALARKGIDLYSFQSCRFKNLFDAPFKYAYPDGTAPGINDSGRASVGGSWEAMAFDFAYLRYGDGNYARFINAAPRQVFQSEGCYFPTVIYEKLKERELEGLTSLIFDSLGYAILRGADAGSQTYLLMDYGPHGGPHGHPDKLNLILYADGDELAGEPQPYRYEDRRHAEWTRPTIAHWTVCVDQREQAPCTGKLLVFADGGTVKVMRGVTDKAYAGVALDRTVVQMPGYVADIFRAWGPVPHTYDYPLCFRGTLDCLAGVDTSTLSPMGSESVPGYTRIRATTGSPVAGVWKGVWRRQEAKVAQGQVFDESVPEDDRRSHPANEVKAFVVGEDGTTVFAGVVPGGRHQAVVRRQGKETVFAAVIDPFRGQDAVRSVERFAVEGPVPAFGLRVRRADGGTDIIIVRYDPQTAGAPAGASTGAGYSTDGLVSIVRLSRWGRVLSAGMAGGTMLTGRGVRLTSDSPAVVWKK